MLRGNQLPQVWPFHVQYVVLLAGKIVPLWPVNLQSQIILSANVNASANVATTQIPTKYLLSFCKIRII